MASQHLRTLNLPSSPPIHGWENLTETNAAKLGQKIPYVMVLCIHTLLDKLAKTQSTFRALARGFTHWESGRVHQ